MGIWLPREHAEAITRAEDGVDEAKRVLGHFYKRLKALDPRLDCFLMKEDVESPDASLRKGFWYVLRRNENGTVSCWEVSNPDGSYREPDDSVIETLQKNDAARTYLPREWKRQQERDRAKETRRRELRREQDVENLTDHVNYRFRASVAPYGRGTVRNDPKRPL